MGFCYAWRYRLVFQKIISLSFSTNNISPTAVTLPQTHINEQGLPSRMHADKKVDKFNNEVQGEVIYLANLATTEE